MIGFVLRNKEPMAETIQDATLQNNPSVQEKSGKYILPGRDNPYYRKALVKRARKLKKEDMTLKKIAETFNEEKVVTVSGTGKWYSSSIAILLNSKI